MERVILDHLYDQSDIHYGLVGLFGECPNFIEIGENLRSGKFELIRERLKPGQKDEWEIGCHTKSIKFI